MSAVVVRNLAKSFGPTRAVRDVSFAMDDGEVLTLLGPSGCGKTTILRCLAGLETPDAGTIDIGPERVFDGARGTLDGALEVVGVGRLTGLATPPRGEAVVICLRPADIGIGPAPAPGVA